MVWGLFTRKKMVGATRDRGQTSLIMYTTYTQLPKASHCAVYSFRPPRNVAPTSKESYSHLWCSGVGGEQCTAYLSILSQSDDGLTDVEASHLLQIPPSQVSARRNDCNKGEKGFLVVNINREQKVNKSGRSALVWRLNK